MNKNLAIIGNKDYKQARSELAEARRIDKQIKELERIKQEKLDLAKDHAIEGLESHIKLLKKEEELCDKKITYFETKIKQYKDNLKNYSYPNKKNEQKYYLELNKNYLKKEQERKLLINVMLKKICEIIGHNIDINEEPIIEYHSNNISDTVVCFPTKYIYKKCICCGEMVEVSIYPIPTREKKIFNISTKLPIKLIDEELFVEFSKENENPKLVLGRPKVILPNVDK